MTSESKSSRSVVSDARSKYLLPCIPIELEIHSVPSDKDNSSLIINRHYQLWQMKNTVFYFYGLLQL